MGNCCDKRGSKKTEIILNDLIDTNNDIHKGQVSIKKIDYENSNSQKQVSINNKEIQNIKNSLIDQKKETNILKKNNTMFNISNIPEMNCSHGENDLYNSNLNNSNANFNNLSVVDSNISNKKEREKDSLVTISNNKSIINSDNNETNFISPVITNKKLNKEKIYSSYNKINSTKKELKQWCFK